jgi:hypothetical protein
VREERRVSEEDMQVGKGEGLSIPSLASGQGTMRRWGGSACIFSLHQISPDTPLPRGAGGGALTALSALYWLIFVLSLAR